MDANEITATFRDFVTERDRPGSMENQARAQLLYDCGGCPWGATELCHGLTTIEGNEHGYEYHDQHGASVRYDFALDAFTTE